MDGRQHSPALLHRQQAAANLIDGEWLPAMLRTAVAVT
jgi:hypothetical protein